MHRRPRFSLVITTLGLLVAFLSGAPSALAATTVLEDPAFTRATDAALADLYDLDFVRARRQLAQVAAAYPGHPASPLLLMLPDWWELLLDPTNEAHDARLLAGLEESLRRAERRLERDEQDLDGRFFKATALAFRGRLASLRGEWVEAAWDGKRALALVREVAREQPHNEDLYFGLGLYDYFADVVPQRYAALRTLRPFFARGDRERGLRELERAMMRGRFASTEAGFFLLEIHLHFERDYLGTLRYARWLRSRHPGNSLFHVYEGRAHASWQQWEKAAPVLDEVIARHARRQPGYVDSQALVAQYFRARCDLGMGNARAALARLQTVERLGVALDSSSNFRVLAGLHRGMAYDALGQRPAAVREYRRALVARDVADSHELARKFLRTPYRWAGRTARLPSV